jgi:hypothetical protein
MLTDDDEELEEIENVSDNPQAEISFPCLPYEKYDSRVRVSVRLNDNSQDRFMLTVDMKSIQTIY